MQILHSHQVSPIELAPEIKSIIETISEHLLRQSVAQIAKPRHFAAEPQQNRATADWLFRAFGDLGYHVERQGPFANIIALPKARFEEATLIGAHYDSVPTSPGADDNASAMAALLACAHTYSRIDLPPPIIFAAFNREEDGFIGSSDFVENWLPKSSFRLRCAHILEMIGYASASAGSQRIPSALPIQISNTGDFLGLLANDQSADTMKRILGIARACTPDLPVTGLNVVAGAERLFPVLARSDHVPFWTRHIPALMWTDTAEFRNPNYHRPTDTPETLDYTFLTRVTGLLAASIIS
jgi:hypothetical protein